MASISEMKAEIDPGPFFWKLILAPFSAFFCGKSIMALVADRGFRHNLRTGTYLSFVRHIGYFTA